MSQRPHAAGADDPVMHSFAATSWSLPMIDPVRCTGCRRCIAACSQGAVREAVATATGAPIVEIDPTRCNYCGDCEGACPERAIDCPIEIVAAWNHREETNG